MENNNERGQILVEALIVTLSVVIVLFTILNNLKDSKQRTSRYGISKETQIIYPQQRSKK